MNTQVLPLSGVRMGEMQAHSSAELAKPRLSEASTKLLTYIEKCKFYIVRTHEWKLVPTLRHVYDTQLPLKIKHPMWVTELVNAGFVRQLDPKVVNKELSIEGPVRLSRDHEVLGITEEGRKYVESRGR